MGALMHCCNGLLSIAMASTCNSNCTRARPIKLAVASWYMVDNGILQVSGSGLAEGSISSSEFG